MFWWICDIASLLRDTFHIQVVFALNLTTNMQQHYLSSYPTDNWQLAIAISFVYFCCMFVLFLKNSSICKEAKIDIYGFIQ